MGKVIPINRAKRKKVNEPAKPNKHYKISEVSKYLYNSNLRECIRLFLIQPSEYPSIEELEEMPVYEARKIIKKLNDFHNEKGEERLIKLTGKTYLQEATEIIEEAIFGKSKKDKNKDK
jgi:hypothetical protein